MTSRPDVDETGKRGMSREQALELFRQTGALVEGHFELRSGLHSDRFFQCARVLQEPRHAERLCRALVQRFREAEPQARVDGVISPALGGLPVGHEVARALGTHHIFAEKQKGRLVLRRGFRIEPGEHYVVAEDVVTRGGRVSETIDIVTSRGGVVSAVLVLVDRSRGSCAFSQPLFSLVELAPQVWEPADCPLCAGKHPLEHPGS